MNAPVANLTNTLVDNLESGKPQTVVAYGTSLTSEGSWLSDLESTLQSRFPGLATVVNRGGSGKCSAWGVENVNEQVCSLRPDALILEFSINDCVARFDNSVEQARRNLEAIVNRVVDQNPDCLVILMTMTLGDLHPEGHESYREDITPYHAAYREVARNRGLLLIENDTSWRELRDIDPERYRSYVPDGVHPIAEADSAMVTPLILSTLGL